MACGVWQWNTLGERARTDVASVSAGHATRHERTHGVGVGLSISRATLPAMAVNDDPQSVRLHNPVLTYSAIAVLLVFAIAALGGIFDPTSGMDRPDWWPGLIFVVTPLLIAVRGLATGVVVRKSEVLLRGWRRTRRLPRDQVLAVKTMRYSGAWTRGSESRLFRMLAVKTKTGTIEVPAVAARNAKAERLASTLRRVLGFAD